MALYLLLREAKLKGIKSVALASNLFIQVGLSGFLVSYMDLKNIYQVCDCRLPVLFILHANCPTSSSTLHTLIVSLGLSILLGKLDNFASSS